MDYGFFGLWTIIYAIASFAICWRFFFHAGRWLQDDLHGYDNLRVVKQRYCDLYHAATFVAGLIYGIGLFIATA